MIRRGFLALLGGLPFMGMPRRPDQHFDPPDAALAVSSQSGVFNGRRVIISASGTSFNGVFVYSPSPAAGNLVASITSAAGTDPFGNAYLAGVTSYVGGQTSQLTGGLVNVTNSFNVSPGGLSSTSSIAGLTELLSPTTGAADVQAILSAYSKNGIAGGPLLLVSTYLAATNPSSGGVEVWHDTSFPLQPGWAEGDTSGVVANLNYRLSAADQKVFLQGTVNQISVTPSATLFTLPSGWRPATRQWCGVTNWDGTNATASHVQINTTGDVVGPLPLPGNGNNTMFNTYFRLTT